MTFEDFNKELLTIVEEEFGKNVKDWPDWISLGMMEYAWMAFNRILIKKKLAILPNDPIKIDDWGRKGDKNL